MAASHTATTLPRVKGGAFLIEDRTPAEIFTREDLSDQQKLIARTAKGEVSAKDRQRGMGELLLPHRSARGIRCARRTLPRRSHSRRQALRPERREDVDFQWRLCRSVYRLR